MNGRPPRANFFDLDDTLIDDSANVQTGWLAAVEAEAGQLGDIQPQALVAAIHEVRQWYWSDPERHRVGRADLRAASTDILGLALARFGLRDASLARRTANRYRDLREAGRSLLPGAIETLQQARDAGVARALLTNGDAAGQRAKLEQFDLARHFDYICIEGEFGCGKPDERVYRGALEALGSAPDATWMVGDNLEWDVAAPMQLGITGIWVDHDGTGVPNEVPTCPDRVIRSIAELLDI